MTLSLIPVSAFSQNLILRGQAQDQFGAVIPGATVTIQGPSSMVRKVITDSRGVYVFTGLIPGEYELTAAAPDLALSRPVKIKLTAVSTTFDLQLAVVMAEQRLSVLADAAPTVNVEVGGNASATVLRGDDLKALGDSPEDLLSDLQSLAGASAGPGGTQILTDGFSGGQLPSKESIKEIRLNQNPFAPEYERLGLGRIEIITKPGSEKFHGAVFYNFADQFWNSRNPYALKKAPFQLHESGLNLSGPLNKKASYFLDLRRDAVDNGSIINAITIDPVSLKVINPYTDTPTAVNRRFSINPRLDYQVSDRHTVTLRYTLQHSDTRNAGTGSFNLTSRGVQLLGNSHTVQLTETSVLNSIAVNEIRFQFTDTFQESIANSSSPAVQVLGAFNGGGAQSGHSFNYQRGFELQDYVTIARSKHSWRMGARLRLDTADNVSPQNFGGSFSFGGGIAPSLDSNNQPLLDATGNFILQQISSIERYRRTILFQSLGYTPARIRELGGGATQFTISSGNPEIAAKQSDLGLFAGDDWHIKPNLTLSLGARYETQSNIRDLKDISPRIAIAWAPAGGKSKSLYTLRGGFGIFYDRFPLANTIVARRYNGIVQQQYVVTNPDFYPTIPSVASLASATAPQSTQTVSEQLRSPYLMQSVISLDRQLPFNTTLAVSYAETQGRRMLRSQDINAPLPGSGAVPLGAPGAIFQMESSGVYRQHQLLVNINSRLNKNISFTSSYVLNRAMSDTDGVGTFPAKPYSLVGEYGPAITDVRQRFTMTGSFGMKWNIRLSPLLTLESGAPFDVTVGKDLYGTTLFNARPGIPSNLAKPGLIQTPYGLLDPDPDANESILSRNYGRGPGQVMFNLRIAKTVEFGGERLNGKPVQGTGRGSVRKEPRKYSLSISMSIRNLLNHNNPGPIIGNITSPLFGQANQPAGAGALTFSESANNRRLELQLRLTF